MALGPHPPKLWRPIKKERAPSVDSSTSCIEGYTFGMRAPIVDFFDHDYITKFAPLEEILRGRADEIMEDAYKQDPTEEDSYLPRTTSGYNFRWIHMPANNMIWIEEIIKRVCESKEAGAKKSKRDKQKSNSKALKAGHILSPKYWKDQQRGCLQHCANHPLYARHMVPFFAEIPIDLERATKSVVLPLPDSATVEDGSSVQTPIATTPRPILDTKNASDTKESAQPATDHNMVLFMPYLHWTTSGDDLDHRNYVINELAEKFRDPDYKRPTPEDIEAENEKTTKMKILRAFLHPTNDRCLHIRRTLDQYYYSTLPDADERTVDQVVYKFAKKQHNKQIEEAARAKEEEKKRATERRERSKWEMSGSSLGSSRSFPRRVMEFEDPEEEDKKRVEVSWDPPKVMMVNQLWMWIIDGDTVITSFPAKSWSKLSMDDPDHGDGGDYMEGDDIYDSTDIWRAVQRELRHKTTYGQRTAKSALDLAWTIADQARGVFQKRNLHPHLQFIQMFEMEINEITFLQAKAFTTFSKNVKAAHNANNIGKLLGLLSTFRKENFATTQTQAWKENFRVFAIDFRRRFNHTVSEAQAQAKAQGKRWPVLVHVSTSDSPEPSRQASRGGSIASSFKPFGTDAVEDETWATMLKQTYNELQETIEHARAIKLTYEDIEAQLLDSLMDRFTDLERIVKTARSTASLSKKLNSLIDAALKSLEWYTDLAIEQLFDITTETNLMTEIKDILDELNIISCVGRQQATVIKPFMRDMLHQSLDTQDKSFHDSTRLEIQIEELQKTAKSTYKALQDLLDLKQKQASVIEARAARKDAKASADQAEASTSLTYETVKQGWAIMIFTIVTIIFLPLSFFTGLFGMNAKELLSGQHSVGFYSAIMYPVSFVIICISLGLALKPEFRIFVQLILKKTLSLEWWSVVWSKVWLRLWRRFGFKKRRSVGRVGNMENSEIEKGMGSAGSKSEIGL